MAGHSGPETAEDSRTHFGIFSPGVTQLFPEGKIINLYPYEYNEVPVLLGRALSMEQPIIALHLTRPPVEIPDREALGILSHFEAAKGAYVMRDFDRDYPEMGTVIRLKLTQDTKRVRLAVIDQGIGMSPKVIERLFEPFFTTRQNGIGLGMSNVKKFIEAIGASIEVDSAEGAGTTITLTFPIDSGGGRVKSRTLNPNE